MAFGKREKVAITPPNIQTARFRIVGTAPYVQNKMSAKTVETMIADQEAGQAAKKKSKRAPKDFNAGYREAMHVADKGWPGLPASAFRQGLISTCRLLGFPMTLAKLSVFVLADGYEKRDRLITKNNGGVQVRSMPQPLIKITKGKPFRTDFPVKNANGGTDIRPRPTWEPGWEATVTIRFDADQFTLSDVTNLLARMGEQVGIGAGRPDSRDSTGMGWGTFRIAKAA